MDRRFWAKHLAIGFMLFSIGILHCYMVVPFVAKSLVSDVYETNLGFHYFVTVRVGKLNPVSGARIWWTVFEGKPNLLVDNGKEFIEDQLGNSANSSVCQHIALSEDTGTPAAGWTELPSEITTGGLDRNTGAYSSTGTGTWTIIYTFTATSGFTVRLTGLHHSASDGSDGNLVAAVAFGTAATMASGDQLEVTWTCSVTE